MTHHATSRREVVVGDASPHLDVVLQLCTNAAALTDAGAHAAAAAMYQRAINAAPSILDLHLLCANAQVLAGEELDARETLRSAQRLAHRPDVAQEFALGKALIDVGAGADAVTSFRRVKKLRPRDAGASAALAAALRDAGHTQEAWREIQLALSLTSRDPLALLTAARIQHDGGEYTRALSFCERSLQLAPGSQTALLTRGYIRLLTGDFTGGWRDLEARVQPTAPPGVPRWMGEPLDGRSLLLIGEQGVGDQLQFLRYLSHPRLKAADEVVVSCQPGLVDLLHASDITAVARGDEPRCDVYLPLLSLPFLLGAAADVETSVSPYLLPGDATRHERRTPPRVGLVWAGNPVHRNDAVRSMPVEAMHRLVAACPGIAFVSMQHGSAGDALGLSHVGRLETSDWLQTARALRDLDLLITVDTGIAHLAGALGVPVWIMLPCVPDWRWGLERDRTAWYPTARLFRQPARNDWDSVMTAVLGEFGGD